MPAGSSAESFVRRGDGRVVHIKIKMKMNGFHLASEPVQAGLEGAGPTDAGRGHQVNP